MSLISHLLFLHKLYINLTSEKLYVTSRTHSPHPKKPYQLNECYLKNILQLNVIINFCAGDRKLLGALFIIFQRITVSWLKIKFSAETISLPEKWKGGGKYAEV